MVAVLLVAVEAHDKAQVYRGIYVADKGVITGRTQSLLTSGPSEGLFFTGLAGNWGGHGRSLTISSHGLGVTQFRVYQSCTRKISTPCDSFVSNYIYDGGVIIFQLTHESGNQATGFVLAGSDTGPKSPVSITFQADDAIALTIPNQGGSVNYCGAYSLPGYCGA